MSTVSLTMSYSTIGDGEPASLQSTRILNNSDSGDGKLAMSATQDGHAHVL